MSLFTINEQTCKKDGACVEECPLRLIEQKDGSALPTPVPDAETRCVKCGHCVAVCPHGALTHSAWKAEDFIPVQNKAALSAEQAGLFLKSRRSIRTYLRKQIEREKLKKLIEIARYAPTGGNSQLVHWLVINDREDVKRISGLVIDLMRSWVEEKKAIAEKYRLADVVTAWESGFDGISRGAPALIVAHAPKDYGLAQVDCTSALAYLDLTAPTFGLGCCWAGFIMMASMQSQPLQRTLALPEGHASFGIMMIGYPKYKYHFLPPRKDAQIIWR